MIRPGRNTNAYTIVKKLTKEEEELDALNEHNEELDDDDAELDLCDRFNSRHF